MSDALITTFVAIALAAHLGALAAALMGRGVKAILALDIAVAVAVLAHIVTHPKAFALGIDWQTIWLGAFEIAVLVVAVAPLRGLRPALAGAWIAFGVHTLALAAALVFALTFKMDRLF